MPRFAVILPAAGKSSRFRDKEKKVFATIDGRPVWRRTAELFVNRKDVCQTVVVVAPEDMETFQRRHAADLAVFGIKVAEGGAERFDSVANALKVLVPEADFVAVHDAARPCVTEEQINAVFAGAEKTGAALLAVPVSDTVKRGDKDGKVKETVPREGLWLAQTPQAFRRDWLEAAYADRARLGRGVTDDAQLVEAAGHTVYLLAGSASNLKITTREDLALADAVLKARPKPKANRPIHPFADDEFKW
jgi:2-C-methyl-D-erythritol 4-phosphate cytidylyltransferase